MYEEYKMFGDGIDIYNYISGLEEGNVAQYIKDGKDLEVKMGAYNPLSYSVIFGNRKITEMLLKAGVDPNSADYENKTALFTAVKDQKIKTTELLLKYGADPNIQKKYRLVTPLMITYNLSLISLMIKYGADWNIVEHNGYDFLELLPSKKRNEIIKKFPEKYDEYLKKKKIREFNI